MRRLAAALLLAAWALAAAAEPAWPVIREITFAGNETTRPEVLLREMAVHVGDRADPVQLERSRQAIQDLRLFSAVDLEQVALGDGVRVQVTVEEKRYLLPLPRVSLDSDGQYSYGVGLRWWNVLGLNHTLHLTATQGNRQEAGRGSRQEFRASYEVPFLLDSPYGLELELGHADEPVTGALFANETTDEARMLFERALGGGGPASHGWRVGGGLQWHDQRRTGALAAASPGHSTALVLQARYDDTRFNLYSEEGLRFDVEGRTTAGTFASDYAYQELTGGLEQAWRVGDTPHQTLGLFAEGGAYDGGPDGVPPPFALGGSHNLRGYPLNFLRGERYYYGGVELLRPLHWDWLRGAVFIEGGDAFGGDGPDGTFADVGIGLRLRWSGFVRTELNLGFAWPLVDAGDGGAARFYASGHR